MKLRIALIAAAATLGLAACESQADKTAENQADAIEKATENRADALENQAAATPNEARETQLNQQADAVEKAGDEKADQVEQEAGKHYSRCFETMDAGRTRGRRFSYGSGRRKFNLT